MSEMTATRWLPSRPWEREQGSEPRGFEQYGLARQPLPGWLIAGLITVGLGALSWYYFGPDVRRYMKIRSM